MKIKHRYNSAQRQHYLLEAHYSFKLKPRLLYVGSLDKHGGWREEPHAHDFFEMVFITDGHGTAIIGESEHELSRGDILIYNAGISHYERSRMDDPMEACFIAYDKLEITDLPPNWLLPSSYGCFFPPEICTAYLIGYSQVCCGNSNERNGSTWKSRRTCRALFSCICFVLSTKPKTPKTCWIRDEFLIPLSTISTCTILRK